MTPFDLLLICAPLVAPVTMGAIVQQESGWNPLALHDNTSGISYQPQNEIEAIAIANKLIKIRHSVDLGIGQINNKNLSWLGQTVETIFQPCSNLNAAQTILIAAWKQSGNNLPGALSAYNTGKVDSSIGANYAASVYAKALHPTPIVPAIPGGQLPNWTFQAIPKTKKTNPNGLTEMFPDMIQTLQAPAIQTGPIQAIIRSPKHESITPAESSLKPNPNIKLDKITPANSPLELSVKN